MACVIQSSVDHNVASDHLNWSGEDDDKEQPRRTEEKWDQTSRQNTADDKNARVCVAQNSFNAAPASSAAPKTGR